jgi:hypothetical protein
MAVATQRIAIFRELVGSGRSSSAGIGKQVGQRN